MDQRDAWCFHTVGLSAYGTKGLLALVQGRLLFRKGHRDETASSRPNHQVEKSLHWEVSIQCLLNCA